MITISRKAHFNAAHKLYRPDWTDEKNKEIFGKCSNQNFHGHNYELIVSLTGKVDPETGYVYDMGKLKNIINIDVSFENIAAKKRKILIQKSLSPDEINLIKNSSLHHYEIEIRFSRHYPLADQIAPLVGFSGKDNYGLEGIEKSYNSLL